MNPHIRMLEITIGGLTSSNAPEIILPKAWHYGWAIFQTVFVTVSGCADFPSVFKAV